MITAVDSSIIFDILLEHPPHVKASIEAVQQALQAGGLVACPIVWSEVRAFFDEDEEFASIMDRLGISYSEIGQDASLQAGQLWRQFRKKEKSRTRIISDFIVGAHALKKCDSLLTRDRGFYRNYFKDLKIIEPK